MEKSTQLATVDLEALEEVDGGWGRRYGYVPRAMGGGFWSTGGSNFLMGLVGGAVASWLSGPRYASAQPVHYPYGSPSPGYQGGAQPVMSQPMVVQSRPLMQLSLGGFNLSIG